MQSACDRSCTVVLLWSPTLNPKIGIPDCFEVVRDRIIFLGAVCLLVCSLFFCSFFILGFVFCLFVGLFVRNRSFTIRLKGRYLFKFANGWTQTSSFFLVLFFCWGCVNLVRKQIQCDSIQRIFVNKLHHQIIVFLLAKL